MIERPPTVQQCLKCAGFSKLCNQGDLDRVDAERRADRVYTLLRLRSVSPCMVVGTLTVSFSTACCVVPGHRLLLISTYAQAHFIAVQLNS